MFSRRKPISRHLAVAALAAALVGCATGGDFRQLTGADVAKVKVGMTSDEVRAALGEGRVGRDRLGRTTYTYRFQDQALVPPYRELFVFVDPASGKVVSISSGTDPSRDVSAN
ncbi:MAG: hypothetical protein MUC55_08615 [Burkholderiales bacterium]|jgi:hypothetical protein|nr:hypothetical protein [Burkholderiales bacterium]